LEVVEGKKKLPDDRATAFGFGVKFKMSLHVVGTKMSRLIRIEAQIGAFGARKHRDSTEIWSASAASLCKTSLVPYSNQKMHFCNLLAG
jgi:hypothetical protein